MSEQLERFRPKYAGDPILKGVLEQSAQVLGEMSLSRFIRAYERFNGLVTVHHDDGRVTNENNWHLKGALEEVLVFVDASDKAGLDPFQAEELLLRLLNATPYNFEHNEVNILLLRRALERQPQSGQSLTKRDIIQIHKMIALAGKEGVIPHSLYGYATARRIGISVKDSTAMIMHLSNADGALAGYTFGSFNKALSTLAIAEVDPDLVRDTFAKLGGKTPYFRQNEYRLFEEAITFGCPIHGVSPEELMRSYFIHAKKGEDITKFYERLFDNDQKALADESTGIVVINPKQVKEKRFINKTGALEHAALAYRTTRSLVEGVKDLERLVVAKGYKWEHQAEGYWVFDTDSNTWYSLGGKTEVYTERVKHNFVAFDLAHLSSKPLLFHIHPEGLEIMLRNPHDNFPSRTYRDHVTKFLSSTPSRADYALVADQVKNASKPVRPRSFIVHSLGMTEFTYPNDLNAIEKMAVESRDIRDQALLNYKWNEITRQWYKTSEAVIVRELVDDLNRRLPSQFSLNLQPTGSIIE